MARIRSCYDDGALRLRHTRADGGRGTGADRAVGTGGEHAIKLTGACLRLHAEGPDPVFLHAAARASDLLGRR
jgi:hypothetical protein